MAIVFSDDFDPYTTVTNIVDLPKQSWWRRLLRLPRPAGIGYVYFHFKFGDGKWQFAEATAEYPEGMDAIKLSIQTRVDGEPIYFNSPKS